MSNKIQICRPEIYLGSVMITKDGRLGEVVAHNGNSTQYLADTRLTLQFPDGTKGQFNLVDLDYAPEKTAADFHQKHGSVMNGDLRLPPTCQNG